MYIFYIYHLGDHRIIVDADITSLLDAAVHTNLTENKADYTISILMNQQVIVKKGLPCKQKLTFLRLSGSWY